MRDVHVIGGAMTRFGKYFQGTSVEKLGTEAVLGALKDAGVRRRDLQACFAGNALGGITVGQRVLSALGRIGIPTFNHENACGSGSTAFRAGWFAVASGAYDLIIVLGVEHMTREIMGLIHTAEGQFLPFDMGLPTPAIFSFMAKRHQAQFGTTERQMARVSVKNHKHGVHNPYAQYRKECTEEDVLASRMIADPLTILQCCPIGDGAAALVLASAEVAKKRGPKSVRVLASAFGAGQYKNVEADPCTIQATLQTARKAYEEAGVGPQDLDVIEVHDCFTIHEILITEDLGLCPKGEGGRLLDEGATAIGGRWPVNPSGGLLCKGHPLGATGIAQIVEIYWHLKGEAGGRQVEGAKVGLAHNAGGVLPISPEPATCSVTILAA